MAVSEEREKGIEVKEEDKQPPERQLALACEDEPLILMMLADMLDELGYAVLEASDGAQAISLAANRRIDVLITDLGLSDMSGKDLAASLFGAQPDLPVIFATGRDRSDITLPNRKVGYLPKPFSIEALKEALLEVGVVSANAC